jgi:hypothetical protein
MAQPLMFMMMMMMMMMTHSLFQSEKKQLSMIYLLVQILDDSSSFVGIHTIAFRAIETALGWWTVSF